MRIPARLLALSVILISCEGARQSHESPRLPTISVDFPEAECVPGPVPAEAAPDVFPLRVDLSPGETATVEVQVKRNGFCDPIEVVVTNVPLTVRVESNAVAWPESVVRIELTADDELSDEIGIASVHIWIGYEDYFEFTLRTRAAEPDWSDAVVGVPGIEWAWGVARLDDSRILVAGIEPVSPDTSVPVVQCVEPGVGPCDDFGIDGVARLPEQPGRQAGWLLMERTPDGSALVATNFRAGGTVLARFSPSGEVTVLEGAPDVVRSMPTNGLAVDAAGRVLIRLDEGGKLHRLLPDGALDTTFGEGGALLISSLGGSGSVWTLPNGRIVTSSGSSLVVLEQDGTWVRTFQIDTGASPYSDTEYGPQRFLPDESVLLGMYECSSGSYEQCEGSVLHADPYGHVLRRWQLGPGRWEVGHKVRPYAFAFRDGVPHVVAYVRPGTLGVFPLGDAEAPVPIVEGRIGSMYEHVGGWAEYDDGRLIVIGTRWYSPEGFGWREAYVWHDSHAHGTSLAPRAGSVLE